MKNEMYLLIGIIVIVFGFSSCNNKLEDTTSTPMEISVEDSILNALGVPSDAKRVVILSHAAHMDWDWLNPFPYNVDESGTVYDSYYFSNVNTKPADKILSLATQNLLADSSYYYSVCEMGFLRAFAKNKPTLFNQMKNTERLRIVGGGITSPDNLLPNGEAFFRNFLVANQWLKTVNIPWSQQVWVPDDFGHDPQLPVMLQAMDAMGVGFSRIPGSCMYSMPQYFNAPQQELLDTTNGVDFIWAASDSSETIAHWLQDHYGQGGDIDATNSSDLNSPADNLVCNESVTPKNPVEHIQAYVNTNGPVAPTPYMYVHVSGDFMIPYQKLVADVAEWNTDTTGGYAKTKVYAVVATFDHYTRLVNCHMDKLKVRSYNSLSSSQSYEAFQPNPYWMGYYASRPDLKTMHNEAARTLLGAEMFQVISNTLTPPTPTVKQNQITELLAAWDSLAPSTHHDYITGTAVDGVYNNEQTDLLKKALSLGSNMKSQHMNTIANNLPADPTSASVAVFNQLGFNNQSIIEYQPTIGDPTYLNVTAPSLGYQVNDISTAQQGDGSLKSGVDANNNYYLSNSKLTARFDADSANLISVIDSITGSNILSGKGNEIVVFNDNGDIYRFGYEYTSCAFDIVPLVWDNPQITFDTTNALQQSITVTKTTKIGFSQSPYTFSITYALRQGEPYLRISTTGSLPQHYTAMVKFPLTSTVDQIDAGTPYHWNTMKPTQYENNTDFNSTMWATHDFVIPTAKNGNKLAAIYHGSTPAWTSEDNSLYGVILRNTPNSCGNWGATGTDGNEHTQAYALRIPSGLDSPHSGQPLMEARQYNTPMVAVALPITGGGNLNSNYSFAQTNTDNSFITAVKWSYADPDALIFRLYQPSNKRQTSTLTLANAVSNCNPVSAIELEIENGKVNPSCAGSASNYQLNLPRAVSSFKLK